MDTFMDKLAQKLTAQEMIKANTAADAEEMKKLKGQIKEYREILEQMQQLVKDGAAKLENAKVDGDEINRLVEESIAKINQIQAQPQDTQKIQESMIQLKQSIVSKLDSVNEDWSQLEQSMAAKLDSMPDSVGEKVDESMSRLEQSVTTKLDGANENIHKECVKVYRNVQAVVVEENNKQTESVVAAVKMLKGKIGAVLGVSIVALIAALGGIAFQVLVYLQII